MAAVKQQLSSGVFQRVMMFVARGATVPSNLRHLFSKMLGVSGLSPVCFMTVAAKIDLASRSGATAKLQIGGARGTAVGGTELPSPRE